jgi:hypothetical protein
MTNFFSATDPLTLQLEEDLSGANGDLAESVVFDRLIENIHKVAGIQNDDNVPIKVVAHLLLAMQRHVQEDKFYLLAQWNDRNAIPDKLDNCLDLRRAIGIQVECVAMRVMLNEEKPAA